MATNEGCLRIYKHAQHMMDYLMAEPEPDVRWAAVEMLLVAKRKLQTMPTPKGELQLSITCPRCNMTSHNPHDVSQHYCGHCHAYIDEMPLAVQARMRSDVG